MSGAWQPDFLCATPILQPLRALLGERPWACWPGCMDLQDLLPRGVGSQGGAPIRFVPQDAGLPYPELSYEERIFRTGMVSTRVHNWHDLFNALVWITMPRTKAALNQAHYREMGYQNGPRRGRCRDALTLFDECGVILAYTGQQTLELLYEHHWKTLFWNQRALWGVDRWPFVFGHALYEKALSPYIGMTGNALAVQVAKRFFDWDTAAQQSHLDHRLADMITDEGLLKTPATLLPFPLLGVPGWYPDNSTEVFFDQTGYFRPIRARIGRG